MYQQPTEKAIMTTHIPSQPLLYLPKHITRLPCRVAKQDAWPQALMASLAAHNTLAVI